MTQPAKIREALNEEMIVGKATDTEVVEIVASNSTRLITPKTRYLRTRSVYPTLPTHDKTDTQIALVAQWREKQ